MAEKAKGTEVAKTETPAIEYADIDLSGILTPTAAAEQSNGDKWSTPVIAILTEMVKRAGNLKRMLEDAAKAKDKNNNPILRFPTKDIDRSGAKHSKGYIGVLTLVSSDPIPEAIAKVYVNKVGEGSNARIQFQPMVKQWKWAIAPLKSGEFIVENKIDERVPVNTAPVNTSGN